MYPNLENILRPIGHKEGRTVKLAILMTLLVGGLGISFVKRGMTWENDRRAFLMLGALAALYLAAIPLGRLRTWRTLQKLCSRFSAAQLQRIELECTEATPIRGVVVTSRVLAGEMTLLPIAEIVWIHEQNTVQKAGVATINELIVVDKERKQHRLMLSVKAGPFRQADAEAVREIVTRLRKHSPGIFFGNDKELTRRFRTDFAGMVAHVEQRAAEMSER
ncbi:MAG: hypothetical protein IJC43_04105 [Clostridia bacterium]|nr:hypothetical protein [Clostridia bacterium]